MNKKSLRYVAVFTTLGLAIASWMVVRLTPKVWAHSNQDKSNAATVDAGFPSFSLFKPVSQATSKDKPAEEVYKNIQVFKGLPSSQLLQAMFFIRGALGVTCTNLSCELQ